MKAPRLGGCPLCSKRGNCQYGGSRPKSKSKEIEVDFRKEWWSEILEIDRSPLFQSEGWSHLNDLGLRSREVRSLQRDPLISRETLWGGLETVINNKGKLKDRSVEGVVYHLHLDLSNNLDEPSEEILLAYSPLRERLRVTYFPPLSQHARQFLVDYLS